MSDLATSTHDLLAEVERLTRRLERERAARLEAERLAEQGMRELYEKQRQAQLLEAIAGAANQSVSVDEALRFAVEQVCRFNGWRLGHAYLAHAHDGRRFLKSAGIWYGAEGAEIDAFRAVTRGIEFEIGDGLPGRVLESGAPAWIGDLSADGNFRRREFALRAGFRAAMGFPARLGEQVVAMLEFFADSVMEPDETLLHLMAQIGTQLGRVVERAQAQEQLMHDASHDPLTGLPNRTLLAHRLQRALARHQRHPDQQFALLFIDLDRFKIVNDSLGHLAGDSLIVQVTARLQEVLREQDLIARPAGVTYDDTTFTLARPGGDEFTILLEDLRDTADAVRVGERLLALLRAPFEINGHEIYISASIGIASSASAYKSVADVLRDADLAMYRAKSLGKGRCEVFDTTMHALAVTRLTLEGELRRALQNHEFVLHYQPIVSLASSDVVGFEALVRWQKPGRGLVYPGEFIDVAEDTGLIVPLGTWVLREACRSMRRLQLDYPREKSLTISVNVSARQFAQPDLMRHVRRVIEETGIPPDSVRLEITESVTMGDAQRTVQVLQSLKELGVRLSIDDFGTGFSSLSYLHRFPLDVLKIDRSFVSRIDQDGESTQIVATIMSLAKNLGMDVVAEGAETAQHVAKLRALGCGLAQGYFFYKPMELARVIRLLEE